MRMLCLLVLFCAFPFIALSQIQPGKAIIDDYAHPAFVQVLHASASKIIIDEQHKVYLAASFGPEVFNKPQTNFTVIRRLSPTHAVIRLNTTVFNDKAAVFQYMLPANNAWKASPALLKALKERAVLPQLVIAVRNTAIFKALFSGYIQVKHEYSPANTLIIQLGNQSVMDTLLASDQLLFADLAHRTPTEELLVSGFDLGTNRVNAVHHHFPALHGDGLLVSVKENRFDTADIDLKGRMINSTLASSTASGHATIMATMMAGAGNSFYEGKGVAWKANVQSVSFSNLLPEPDSYYSSQQVSVQNHSYGTGIENFYGADASAYDASVVNNDALLHIFSAGNSGLAASNGPYAGITGFANLTGSFKMAKNILVAGAIDSTGNIEMPSSKGPAYDGRIKPELVAFGQDGSSGAASVISGIALLLQHAYRVQHHDSFPAAALVKAVLINTADDVGAPGPDFSSGYGNANAYRAVHAMNRSQFFSNSIPEGSIQTFNLQVPSGLRLLKLTLAWTDPPAAANAAKALVNDLDLELVHLPSGQSWQPWILNRLAHGDSLQLAATRGKDTLNNVEQITLDDPPPGDYIITVKGSRVINSPQPYFIIYGADTANRFEWMYPMPADPVEAGSSVMMRWNSGFPSGITGQLDYSLTNGNTWQTIAANADISRNYIRWNTPDTFSTALLRMKIGSSTYTTDAFVISKRMNTQVGFNCTDSFLFYWNKPKGVNSFRVYKRGDKFLEPVTVTNDTFYLAASKTEARLFTVAPIVNNKEGIRSYTFDYTSQGVACYFKSFLTQLNVNKAALQLELGSVYRVTRIIVQKLSGNTFKDIQVIGAPSSLQFNFEDASLHQGVNTYRIALQLADGRMIYSNTETVYYLSNTEYIIYPNPARTPGSFSILQKEPSGIRVMIYDVTGRIIKDETHSDIVNTISTANLQKGLYIIVIEREGVKTVRKVIVN